MGLKHPVERTCLGCAVKRPQAELLRIASHQGAAVRVDTSGKASGRGAYLCFDASCLERAWKRRALQRALRLEYPPDEKLRGLLARIIEER